ncbi:Anoctamin-1 [Symbiodinium microadriaticum]|uniref:Anoctamin-1 n=1 Tax=Symbiodinium microadriaticum TaxID=2951 RepID=A0A1Q9DTT7_SYMMI|nr:Anoctamin-1 [Symbiodinium microadriaticum]
MQFPEDAPASRDQAAEGLAEVTDACIVEAAPERTTAHLEDDAAASAATLIPVGEVSTDAPHGGTVEDAHAAPASDVVGEETDQAVVEVEMEPSPTSAFAEAVPSTPVGKEEDTEEQLVPSQDAEAEPLAKKKAAKKRKVFHKGSAKQSNSSLQSSKSPAVLGKQADASVAASTSESLKLTPVAPSQSSTFAGQHSDGRPSSAEKSGDGAPADGTVPQAPSLPAQLPFHFHWDVSCVRLESEQPHLPANWERAIVQRIEREWRRCRKEQEQAWVSNGNVPFELQRLAAGLGASSDELFARVCERTLSGWHVGEARGTRPTMPMKVVALDTIRGQAVQKEDLEALPAMGSTGSIWCHLTYDLGSDPLLQDLGYARGSDTTFSTLLFVYGLEATDSSEKSLCDVRCARMDHFDFALCFPPAPYPTYNLPVPEVDFPTLLGLEAGSDIMSDDWRTARAVLTWLFWDCFDEIFSPHATEIKLRDKPGRTLLPFGVHRRFDKKLKDCGDRAEALGCLLATMRPQPFQLPFRTTVTKEEADAHCEQHGGENVLLAAVEVAFQKAACEYNETLGGEGLPKQWLRSARQEVQERWPLHLESSDCKARQMFHEVSSIPATCKLPCASKRLAVVHCKGIMRLSELGDSAARSRKLTHTSISADLATTNQTEVDGAELGEIVRTEIEDKEMDMTLDLSRWDDEGVMIVGDININDHVLIREVLLAVEQMETCADVLDCGALLKESLRHQLSHLAHGLRAMQRASLKTQLRSVGLAVFESERLKPQNTLRPASLASRALRGMQGKRGLQLQKAVKAGASGLASALEVDDRDSEDHPVSLEGQQVMLLSAPEGILRKQAEARRMLRRVLPNRSNEFVGGFTPSQFDQGGPLQQYWSETIQKPYHYRPYFCSAVSEADPSSLLSPSERRYLVKRLVTDPLVDTKLPDGRSSHMPGGANLDPRELRADDIIEGGLVNLQSSAGLLQLANGFIFPWRAKGWRYFIPLRRCDTALVLRHFGPKTASYFEFLETYSSFLFMASVAGIFAELAGPPNAEAEFAFWKIIRPSFGICMCIWGACFCIFWRRRAAQLAFSWANGWIEEGDDLRSSSTIHGLAQVRPEFASRWRQNFEKAGMNKQEETLDALRAVLRAPSSSVHFGNRALRHDIAHFDETCYQGKFAQLWRSLFAYAASGCFIVLACGATYGTLAANYVLGLSNSTLGYMVMGFTTSVFVPLLNTLHHAVVIFTNEYQLFRQDSDKERDLFDRLFVFALFNTYNSLLWIAFAERNMEQLRVQVMFIMVFSRAIVNNMLEFYWLLWMKQIREAAANMNPRHAEKTIWRRMLVVLTGDFHDEVTDTARSQHGPEGWMLDQLADQLTRDTSFEQVKETIELVIQYGLVMMFTLAFPLTPLIALIDCNIEKRLDAFKIVRLQRSPEPRMVVGLGQPFRAFVFVTALGLLVSGLMLYFTEYAGEKCARCTMFGNCGSCGGTGVDLILPNVSLELRLFLLSAGEHLLLILMFIFFSFSPISTRVLQEQYRQKLYENRLQLEAASEGQMSLSTVPRRSRKDTQDTSISTDHL